MDSLKVVVVAVVLDFVVVGAAVAVGFVVGFVVAAAVGDFAVVVVQQAKTLHPKEALV